MAYFCHCKKCRNSSKDKQGRFLKTKKTYKKHQKAELLIQNASNASNGSNSTISTNTDSNDNEAMEISSEEESKNHSYDLSDEQMLRLFQSIKNSSSSSR